MRFRSVVILSLVLFVAGLLGLRYFEQTRLHRITVAAGPVTGQAYQVAKAIQETVSKNHPNIQLEIFETRGSLHSGQLLKSGEVHLALTQADQVLGGDIRLIASLYSDAYQLIVRKDSGISELADLAGKRVALPPELSGDNKTFWFLAEHYGFEKNDLKVFAGTEMSTEWLFVKGEVDALFRVRSPGDQSILRLIEKTDAKFVPIRQAAALELRQPALEKGIIPAGSYQGRPVIPEQDTDTVSVRRLLVARADIPDSVVSILTSVLFERRRELVAFEPATGWIAPPDRVIGTFLPVHPGAQAFYDKDRPSFLQENAEPIALFLSILLISSSLLIQLNTRRRKRVMDRYNRELIQLAKTSRKASSFEDLDQLQSDLAAYVDRIVESAENGNISSQDMTLFRFTFDAVEDAIRDREVQLERSDLQSLRPVNPSTKRRYRGW